MSQVTTPRLKSPLSLSSSSPFFRLSLSKPEERLLRAPSSARSRGRVSGRGLPEPPERLWLHSHSRPVRPRPSHVTQDTPLFSFGFWVYLSLTGFIVPCLEIDVEALPYTCAEKNTRTLNTRTYTYLQTR